MLNQLIEAKRGKLCEVFDYDVSGGLQNILKSLADVDRVHPFHTREGGLLIGTPDAWYENDGQGRRSKRIDKETGETTEYLWDCRDRLREVALPDGRRVLFTYDAFGRRVRKETVPAERRNIKAMTLLAFEKGADALPPICVVEYLWDGDALAGELDPMRGARFFVHEPGTVVPMLQQEQGEVFTYVNDHLGMPKELVDQDGRVAWAAAHSAWGKVVETWRDPKAKRAVETPFRLLGQYLDDETGLCYTRFRYFDPAVGRWLSQDPLGFAGGRNLFAFGGSPTFSVDPLGLTSTPPYVFRGTTAGYPGNPSLQRMGISPASTNSAVATVFATEASQYGPGVVQTASTSVDLAGVPIEQGNVLAEIEREVAVEVPPAEFEQRAGTTISVEDSRRILADMGIETPYHVTKRSLSSDVSGIPDMTPEQVEAYVKNAKACGGCG